MSVTCRLITEHTNKRTRQDLIDAMKKRGASMVVDVRLTTKYPLDGRFYPEVLRADLEKNGIAYLRLQGLGNKFKDVRPMEESKRRYLEDIVTTNDYKRLIDLVASSDFIIALICYCEPPRPCHRKWLQERVMNHFEAIK